mmetsp:Transcript_35090/g.97022  ORF Transcript_35090/g.97022 Transcript_35090/m.97022 type:complete len:232 (+) Transcript_35090:428-1123(+)
MGGCACLTSATHNFPRFRGSGLVTTRSRWPLTSSPPPKQQLWMYARLPSSKSRKPYPFSIFHSTTVAPMSPSPLHFRTSNACHFLVFFLSGVTKADTRSPATKSLRPSPRFEICTYARLWSWKEMKPKPRVDHSVTMPSTRSPRSAPSASTLPLSGPHPSPICPSPGAKAGGLSRLELRSANMNASGACRPGHRSTSMADSVCGFLGFSTNVARTTSPSCKLPPPMAEWCT